MFVYIDGKILTTAYDTCL